MLAGNVFDWGAKEVVNLMEAADGLSFAEAQSKLERNFCHVGKFFLYFFEPPKKIFIKSREKFFSFQKFKNFFFWSSFFWLLIIFDPKMFVFFVFKKNE